MTGRLPRLQFARSRIPNLCDECIINPPSNNRSGRVSKTVPCGVMTPTLKLGHGYGSEGGGSTLISRRVTKTILFDRGVRVEPGDEVIHHDLETEETVAYVAGEPGIISTLDPTIQISCTIKEGPRF